MRGLRPVNERRRYSHWLGGSLESAIENNLIVWTDNGSREASCYGIVNPINTCVIVNMCIICDVYSMAIILYRSFWLMQ